MTFLVATVAFPALLALLALGCGLLVDRLAGWRVPGLLLLPVGFAALVIVSQLTTLKPATAPFTPAALAICAAAGLLAGARRLRALATALRANPLPAAATLTVYVLACAPVLLAGHVTEAAYLLDTTDAIQMAGADRLLSHGLDFGGLAESGYKLQLQAYFGSNYPSGAHTVLGGVGRLVGSELTWLYQPFLAAMLALCAPSLYLLGRAAGMGRRLASAAAVLAATPALVYAYALMGAIKEIALLPLILVLAALLVVHRAWLGRSVRAYLPIVLVAGAGVATIGIAFAPWLVLAGAIGGAVALNAVRERRLAPRSLAIQVAAIVAVLAVAALPTLIDFSSSAALATSLSQGNADRVADPGNLLQPIHAVQSLGVWLHGSHRVDPPKYLTATYAFIGAFLVAVALGIAGLARRRAWALLAFVAGSAVIWWALTIRGAVWTDAKLIVLVSPLVVLLAGAGAGALLSAGRRVEGVLLAATLAVGVLWSDALAYHDTNLAPTARFEELSRIDARFAGDGPALLPDFDEYALYVARRLDVSAPGYAFKPRNLGLRADGVVTGYGTSYDLDDLRLNAVRAYPLLVLRRSPQQSHPPTGYRRAFVGRYYEVWRRTPAARSVIAHVPSGRDVYATGRPRCARVRRAAERAARAGGVLRYLERPRARLVDPRKAAVSASFLKYADGVAMTSAGRIDTTVRFPRGGRFTVWLKGDFSRTTQFMVDDRVVGQVAYQSGGDGNYATPMQAQIAVGARRLTVRRPGGSWRPGDDAGARLERILLEPEGVTRAVDVAPARWRSVCAIDVDWVEAIR